MSQELFGKWYVYRYKLDAAPAVLKAPETTLEVSGQTQGGCLARFELSDWTEPVEVAMETDEKGYNWRSKAEGSCAFLDVRWVRVEHSDKEPAVLQGQIVNKDDGSSSLPARDFFVAVRSRRTHPLPELSDEPLHFAGAYLTPFLPNEPSDTWDDPDHQGGSLDKSVIRFGRDTFAITALLRYNGGLKITGTNKKAAAHVTDEVTLWILPAAEPGQSGRLLAIGYHQYQEETASGADPHCHTGTGVC